MSRVCRGGSVYIQNRFAGRIEEIDEGYRFSYDEAYLESENPVAVSLTLPLRREAYISPVLFAFFDGLIPEGWLLNMTVKNWKLMETDRFGQLLVACRDCIGDVSIRQENLGVELI